MALTVPPDQREQSFLGHPVVTDLDHLDAHVAILGIQFGKPYRPSGMANPQSLGPAAVRAASCRIQIAPEHYDFDPGG